MGMKWIFMAYESSEDYRKNKPFFEIEFKDHTKMKVFSAKHSAENISKYPNYVSNYITLTTKTNKK